MRILFINVLYSPLEAGGAEITLKNLVEGVRNLGHEVKVLSFWDKVDKEEVIDGISVYRAKIPNVYLPYGKITQPLLKRRLWHVMDIYNPISKGIVLKQIRDFQPDIISIHNTQGWSCSVWDAVAEAKVPAIQVFHDLYILCHTNMFKNNYACKKHCFTCKLMTSLSKLKSNQVKAVVGISRFVLDTYLKYGYFSHVPIKKVIYNSRKPIDAIIDRKVDPLYFNLGFIGSLAPNKGIEVLLKAYHKIKKTNYRLYIAGSAKDKYEAYLKSKYADDSIIFMGRVKPEDFFEKVDVTIVPSKWYENFPGVIVESLSFGVPVIGSNIGGIPEMITEGVNGKLFDPYQENDLVDKILSFEKSILDWRNKQETIKNNAQRFLDYNAWIQQWQALYDMVVNT